MLIKVGILEEKEEQIGPTVGYVLGIMFGVWRKSVI